MSAARRQPRRRIADVPPADRWLIPVDYVAAVYGTEAAESYIIELNIADDSERQEMIERSRRIGELGVFGVKRRLTHHVEKD